MPRPRAIAFDMIGTVFAIEALQPPLDALGLPPLAVETLYGAALRDSFALACADGYVPFLTVLEAALVELLARAGIDADEAGRAAVLDAFAAMPAHPDAHAAFALLREAEVPVFALSNGAAAATRGLLEAAGLIDFMAGVLSVESVRLSKPRPETYRYAAHAAGVPAESMALVATHPWDVNGAIQVGLQGGFVSRGRPYPTFFAPPTAHGDTLVEVARALLG